MKAIRYLMLSSGIEPARDWLMGLDKLTRARIRVAIDRVADGGAKRSVRALKDGVFEIKVDTGPGYRVYFGESGKDLIVLLVGGDKRSQDRDIRQAKMYWEAYVQK